MLAAAVRVENVLATLALGGIMLLPLAEIAVRGIFGTAIPGAGPFAQNLTIWVGLLGAAIAAREGKLLTLATGEFLPAGVITKVAHVIAGFVGAAISTMFAVGGVALVQTERAAGDIIAVDVPVWVSTLAFPLAFSMIAARLVWRASPHWLGRAIALSGIILGYWLATNYQVLEGRTIWPWILGIVIAGMLGAPIFTLLG